MGRGGGTMGDADKVRGDGQDRKPRNDHGRAYVNDLNSPGRTFSC